LFLVLCQINFESDDSDEECLETYLSDDDCLEQHGALQKLKSGYLPLDIKALHSVCLLGIGGQDYVALMNLERVIISSDMTLFNDDVNPDVSIGNDPQWLAFSKYFKLLSANHFCLPLSLPWHWKSQAITLVRNVCLTFS